MRRRRGEICFLTKNAPPRAYTQRGGWCPKAIHIRTFFLFCSLSGLAERNGLRPFFVVEGNQHFIVIEVNSIDEGVDQRLPLFLLGQVQLTEVQQPEADKFFFHDWLGQFFFGNLCFQVFFLGFEGFQTFFGGAGQDTGLDGVEHILDAGLGLPELLLVEGQAGALPILQLHDCRHKGINDRIVLDQLHGFVDHQILQPLLADSFLCAPGFLFSGCAFIIAVCFTCAAGTAFTKHQRTAVAAE